MLKKIFTTILLFSLVSNSFSQSFEWAKSFGGGGLNNTGYSIDVDGKGNVYTTGRFKGTYDFDPGPSIYNLTSNGEYDVFISKLDKNGNFLWAKSFGGLSSNVSNPNSDIGYSIVADKDGNVYVCGAFENTVDFDPGVGIYNLTSAGSDDIFILKLDTDGNLLWVKHIGGVSIDVATSITIDNGYLYTTGYFYNTIDFDPGPGVFNLGGGVGGTFILKLEIDGDFLWAKYFEGRIEGNSITTDNNGNILITGYFVRTVNFDPDAGNYNLSSVFGDEIFISKLDSNGNFLWAKSIEGLGHDVGNSITTDDSGNIYTTGNFGNTADFDPGPSIFNLSSTYVPEIFVLKF